jgi:lysophospholipase L1-like esterase
MPAEVKAFQVSADAARAAGRKPDLPAPAVSAAYAAWQQKLFAVDFPGVCRYRAANAALPPATKRRIVFFGDSITERWITLRPDFFAGDRVDRGIGGQTTRQMIGRFRADVVELHPEVVHILAGINDLAGATGPTSLSEIEGNLASMSELARVHRIKVVLGAVLPARALGGRPGHDPASDIASLNAWLRAYAAREGFGFVDYHVALDDGTNGLSLANSADGIHPTVAGYAIMEPLAEKAFARAVR